MSRKPIHTPKSLEKLEREPGGIRPEDPATVASVDSDVDGASGKVLVPTDSQLMAKCRFWARLDCPVEELSVAEMCKLAGTSSLRSWLYSKPGFRDWFLNRDDAREKIYFLYQKILDTAIDVLASRDFRVGDLQNLAKTIATIEARLFPEAVDDSAEQYESMSEEELVALIESKGISVNQVIQVAAEDEDGSDEE